ncbi:MAG TPA: ferrochelatase [Kofleriaceae bacterium]|nr:ferrochelatase [Kofleriaceae bacterium]
MIGLLLLNLGTPAAPTIPAVRRYLRQFLSDPRVIDIPAPARAALLNLVILPRRPTTSAAQYRTIWDPDRGSPLLFHSLDLRDGVQRHLGDGWRVELGMRYGDPSIPDAMTALHAAKVSRVVVLPLFPQYAASSTGSALEVVYGHAAVAWNTPPLAVVPPFYDDPEFLDAFAARGRAVLAENQADHILFSFHGLPERHLQKSDDTGAHCLCSDDCCDRMVAANRNCYRAQCVHTAHEIAARLSLEPKNWTITFQSRLGRTPWIQPFTDVVIPKLADEGARRLVIFCPSFVADCLETLEEIGVRAQNQFREAGGTEVVLVPSLNSEPAWVKAVCNLALRAAYPQSEAA